ncbi:MAG: PAS domain S-box protein [Ignavibacteria bacterium]|nr:PAS domain S-box protein [Ignavibacteria bacterium]
MSYYKHFFLKFSKAVILSESHSGKILDVNEKALSLFNKSNEDFNNLKRSDIFPQKAIKEINNQLKNSKDTASTNTFILNKEGTKVDVEINSELIFEDNKEYLLDIISVEHKAMYPELIEAERLVKESEIKYKTLFETANDAILLLKGNAIVELNSKALEMFAATKEDLLGKTPFELSPDFQPDGSNSFEKAQEKINNILNGESQFFEWQHKRIDGFAFDAEVSLNSITFNNEIVVLAVVRDVTQRKHDEFELKQNEAKFRSLVEESLVGVYIIQDGKFPYVNPRLAEIFGYTVNEIISIKNVDEFVYEPDRKIVRENISKRLSGKIETMRYSFRKKR